MRLVCSAALSIFSIPVAQHIDVSLPPCRRFKHSVVVETGLMHSRTANSCLSIYIYIYLSICLSVYLSVYLYICLHIYIYIFLSVYLSIYRYIYIYLYIYLSVCLSICLSIYIYIYIYIFLSVCLSVCLSVYLSIYLSIFLSIYLSVCLSIYLFCLCICCFLSLYLSYLSLCLYVSYLFLCLSYLFISSISPSVYLPITVLAAHRLPVFIRHSYTLPNYRFVMCQTPLLHNLNFLFPLYFRSKSSFSVRRPCHSLRSSAVLYAYSTSMPVQHVFQSLQKCLCYPHSVL